MRAKQVIRVLAALLALLVLYVGFTAWQVWDYSRSGVSVDEAVQSEPVDAIVVLGAAQYDGAPSPVLEGRLRRALALYDAGRAQFIITTGSNQEGDRFTEGYAGYTFLRDQGVPDEALLFDIDGGNTYEQLTSAFAILNDRDLNSVILVSDSYHSYRLLQMADEVGLRAEVSPTELDLTLFNLARETAAVSVGRVIGFRRLSNLRG